MYTRVRGPETYNYKNLVRVMKYTQLTICLSLIISINKSGNIKWYVDAEFTVHKYMRRHTGVFMTMGIGGAYVHSSKQNLNIKNSTEDKIFGVDDVLTQLICTRNFLK